MVFDQKGIVMYFLVTTFRFNGFNGDSLDLMDTLQDNILDHRKLVLRGILSEGDIRLSLSQISPNTFTSRLSVSLDDNSLSEDVICGQLESNIHSMNKRGILSINLHDWELTIETECTRHKS